MIQAQLIYITDLVPKLAHIFSSVLSLRNILDVLIISIFFYFAIIILQKIKSTSAMAGVVMFIVAYGAGIILNLPLTRTIFQYFFGFFLIIVAIIFQNEFRRFFSLIGVLGGRRRLKASDQMFDILVHSVRKLASAKIGALIVLPAEENIQSYVRGGYPLDGKVSEPLLLSIFDSSSPGHDGAIIIEDGRIKKFGVYLPLGRDVELVRSYGTRHLAALGLSEISDALIISISEEKGTVSIFRNKTQTIMKNDIELEEVLNKFSGERFPQLAKKDFKKWAKTKLAPVVLSLTFAFVFWAIFSFETSSSIQKKLAVPLEFKNAPSEFIVESKPDKLTVTFSGKEMDFNESDIEKIKVSVDLSKIKPERQKLEITEEDIKYPLYISVVKIEPESISLNFVPQSE